MDLPAKDIALRAQAGKAAQLVHPDMPQVGVSIAHSGPWIACAASVDAKLGVDIEVRDSTRDVLALAEHTFDEGELAQMRGAGAAAQTDMFYALWCAKEAQIKLGVSAAARVDIQLPGLMACLCSDQTLSPSPQATLQSTDFVFSNL